MAYVYREFPRHLHKAGGEFVVVSTPADRDAHLAAGWSLVPVLDAACSERAVVPGPVEAPAETDDAAETVRRVRRGRPPKARE